jgi:hypothetical protein
MKIQYEHKACTRCGGCGRYSWCQMYGDTCFRCNGTGKEMTRNGKAAFTKVRAFMAEHYSVPVEKIETGMTVRHDGRWKRVIEGAKVSGCRSKGSNEEEWTNLIDVMVAHKPNGMVCGFWPGTMIETRPTPEQFKNELVPYAKRFKGTTVIES